MNDKPVKIIIDTNLWISFLIGKDISSIIRNLLTNKSVSIIMTEILQAEIVAVASRPKFARYFAPEACKILLSFLKNRCKNYPLADIIPPSLPSFISNLITA